MNENIELLNAALKELGEIEIRAKHTLAMANVIARLQKVGSNLVESEDDGD